MDAFDKKEKPYGFWNWGTGIAIAIIVAASLMIFLVYKSMNVTFDMAEKDYYQEELKFDSKIKAMKNANSLSAPLSINETEELLVITFPEECAGLKLEGNLVLYRPSEEKKDVHLPLTPDENGNISVSKSKLSKGLYRLKADWVMEAVSYRIEKDFFVNQP